MGRHALPAAPDAARSAAPEPAAPEASPSTPSVPAELRRPRGRRAAPDATADRAVRVEHAPAPRVVHRPTPRPLASTAVAGSAVLTRTAVLRAERAADPRHVRRAVNAKRAALLLAPALAVTSSLTLALPADAAPATSSHDRSRDSSLTTAADDAQSFTVARDVEVPVVRTDGITTTTTVVSYPTIVTKYGVTTQQAEDAISAVLSAGWQARHDRLDRAAVHGRPVRRGRCEPRGHRLLRPDDGRVRGRRHPARALRAVAGRGRHDHPRVRGAAG